MPWSILKFLKGVTVSAVGTVFISGANLNTGGGAAVLAAGGAAASAADADFATTGVTAGCPGGGTGVTDLTSRFRRKTIDG